MVLKQPPIKRIEMNDLAGFGAEEKAHIFAIWRFLICVEAVFLQDVQTRSVSRFFFAGRRRKEKANKKKRRFAGSARTRDLLKKVDQNLHARGRCAVFALILPLLESFWKGL